MIVCKSLDSCFWINAQFLWDVIVGGQVIAFNAFNLSSNPAEKSILKSCFQKRILSGLANF